PGTGGSACASLDQRGLPRPQPSRCDIGAYEEGSVLCMAPRAGCAAALPRASAVAFRRAASGAARFSWKWKGDGVAAADFGDPLADTGYVVCAYDTQAATPVRAFAALVPPGSCPSKPCWKSVPTGFAYRNGSAT